MPAPTQAEANAHANRVDNFGRALKTAGSGGPFRRAYNNTGGREFRPARLAEGREAEAEQEAVEGAVWEREADYQAQHPRYPDYHYPDDKERDTYMMVKKQLASTAGVDGFPGVSPFGMMYAGDKEIQYLIDKKNAQELALFKAFVEDSIPRGTPWAREFFERIMPGWYQSKIDIIQDKLAIINRFIDMSIRGPQNMEDMFLLYQLYTGKIEIPNNWPALIKGNEVVDAHFATGLFNPKRWIDETYRISKRNQEFMANFAIPGIDPKGVTNNAVSNVLVNNVLGAEEMDYSGAFMTRQTTPEGLRGFFDHKMIGTAGEGLIGGQSRLQAEDPARHRWTAYQQNMHQAF